MKVAAAFCVSIPELDVTNNIVIPWSCFFYLCYWLRVTYMLASGLQNELLLLIVCLALLAEEVSQ